MTAQDFRRIALGFPASSEGAHMGHPDFRVCKKIFATLDYPEKGWGMVKLTPQQQQVFVQAAPEVFVPVKGGWGRQGATNVRLKTARKTSLCRAMATAWLRAAPKRLREEFKGIG